MASADEGAVPARIAAAPRVASSTTDAADQSSSLASGEPLNFPPVICTSSPAQVSDSAIENVDVTSLASADDDEFMDVSDGVANLPSTVSTASASSTLSHAASMPSRGGASARTYSAAASGIPPASSSSRLPPMDSYVTLNGDTILLDIPENSPAGQRLHSTLELGVCFDALPNTPLKQYSSALKKMLPSGAITHLTRKPRTVIVYFSKKEYAELVLSRGLSIGDRHLLAESIAQRPVLVSLHPVPPEISDDMLCAALSRCGRVVGPVKTLSSSPSDPDDKHICGFRRTARIIFPSEEHLIKFPRFLDVRCGNERRRIELLTSAHCSRCKAYGHQQAQCPHAEPLTPAAPRQHSTSSSVSAAMPPPASAPPGPSSAENLIKAFDQHASSDVAFSTLSDFPPLDSSLPSRVLSPSEDITADLQASFTVGTFAPGDEVDLSSDSTSRVSSIHGKRRSTTSTEARRKKKKSPSPTGRPHRSTRLAGSKSPLSRSSSSSSKSKGPLPTFEDFSTLLTNASLPSEPVSFEDLYEFLTHKTNREASLIFLQQFEAVLPEVFDQATSILKFLRHNAKQPDYVLWCRGIINRLDTFQKAAIAALHPTSDLPIQGRHSEL